MLFDTHAFLLYPLCAVYKLKEADLTPTQLAQISAANAAGILRAS